MWIAIVIVIVIAIILFKYFDRDFIKVTQKSATQFFLEFENGKQADCVIIEKTEIEGNTYCVFIPIDSMNSIPDEDIIILRVMRHSEKNMTCVFASGEIDEQILQSVKKKYATKYRFVG